MAADPVAGKTGFARCSVCHSLKPGVNMVGPSLAGVIGRKVGTAPDYRYSKSMIGSQQVWTPALVSSYLAGPMKMFPGGKMTFLDTDPKRRDDIAAYLATNPTK